MSRFISTKIMLWRWFFSSARFAAPPELMSLLWEVGEPEYQALAVLAEGVQRDRAVCGACSARGRRSDVLSAPVPEDAPAGVPGC